MKGKARLVVMDSVWGHMGKLEFSCQFQLLLHTENMSMLTCCLQPEEDPTNKIPISW